MVKMTAYNTEDVSLSTKALRWKHLIGNACAIYIDLLSSVLVQTF